MHKNNSVVCSTGFFVYSHRDHKSYNIHSNLDQIIQIVQPDIIVISKNNYEEVNKNGLYRKYFS